MAAGIRQHMNALYTNEHASMTYLFRRRWPLGFKCPFCGSVLKEMSPAYTVVCRYCRKQTSITAQTLMHGSKKDLGAWLQVAWLFCSRNQGLSARQLQRLMGLSCYQTAWSWLQKIRLAAALAESAPCRGVVLFDISSLPIAASVNLTSSDICIALELNSHRIETARIRFQVLESQAAAAIAAAIGRLVMKNATLQVREQYSLCLAGCLDGFHFGAATAEQIERGRHFFAAVDAWLQRIFRKAVDPDHLQGYLDEFSFHNNTAFWPEQQAVLDHLVTALLSTSGTLREYAVKTR